MPAIYLPPGASRARIREAERARDNRREIIRELSWGRVSRRDLIKWGIFTSAGLLAPINGLNPFASKAYADGNIPRSPLFGAKPFSQPMPRFDLLERKRAYDSQKVSTLTPAPTPEANETKHVIDPLLRGTGGDTGPIEGRPPGPMWAHQRWNDERCRPKIAVEATQAPATTNTKYNPGVDAALNSGINKSIPLPPAFYNDGKGKLWPVQDPESVWTFNGTIPPKLLLARYGEPILFRHHNRLPADISKNGGFGRHTISTHEHNGHHGAENDGFTGAFFFPGQFYDYHWPIVLAGCTSVNQSATDKYACTPNNDDDPEPRGTTLVPGDWHETMSTHWFHDHMFSYTSQNVYKGNAAMMNIYSGLDRGNEEIEDTVNLHLPSGTAKSWGNLDYDVNLMIADKAFDSDGQLLFDVFNDDGFLGDVMTVNLAYKPYFEVERRRYRFRILNASVARFFKIALTNASGVAQQIWQIGNDGNLLPHPVSLTALDEQGIAERYDIVIDFSRYAVTDPPQKLYLVNLCEHDDGRGPKQDLSVAAAFAGRSDDPCVGKFLEFRVVREPANEDQSRELKATDTLIPNPELSKVPFARERTFVFGRGGLNTTFKLPSSFEELLSPWTIRTDGGEKVTADWGRVSAAPRFGTREVWHLVNDGGGWDHPIHIHFEEGQILARNGSASQVPLWERGRKDTYRLRPGGTVTITMQFRDWGGMFMEHCHNTTHEDKSMLLRWEIDDSGEPFLAPLPTPIPTPQGVTYEKADDILPGAF
jgi:FtsP/CotA-like multicopper oxidase with cupredoxin domain